MNCLWKISGARDLLGADEQGEICFISKLHADMMETIFVLKEKYESFCVLSCVSAVH